MREREREKAAAAAAAAAAASLKEKEPEVEQDESLPSEYSIFDCLVCGKTFARGQADLYRHQNAPTLKHLTSHKKASGFTKECSKGCGVFFSSADHKEMHESIYRCEVSAVDKFKEREREKENERLERIEKEKELEREKEKESRRNATIVNTSVVENESSTGTSRPKRSSRVAALDEEQTPTASSSSSSSVSGTSSTTIQSNSKDNSKRVSRLSSVTNSANQGNIIYRE
jgi:hypothetical protein